MGDKITNNVGKHGKWFLLDDCANAGVYCSVCTKKVYKENYANQKIKSPYCPNCGARMDLEEIELKVGDVITYSDDGEKYLVTKVTDDWFTSIDKDGMFHTKFIYPLSDKCWKKTGETIEIENILSKLKNE